jgi:hypothetical protein
MSTDHPAAAPAARTTHIAEIEDPVTGEITVLEAATAAELDELIEAHTADPTTPRG